MQVNINAKLTTKEMFDFLMHHNYRSFGGVTGVLLSLGALVIFFLNIGNEDMRLAYKVALLVIGLVYTVIQPIMLYKKAATQVKVSDSVNKPLTYTFTDEDLTISLEDEKVTHQYEDVLMIKSTRVSILIYVTVYRAFILPKKDIGDNFEELKDILKRNVKNARCVDIK